MKGLVLACLLLVTHCASAQVWSEVFDEADGATTGTGSPSGNWSSTCVGCSDPFDVSGGLFRAGAPFGAGLDAEGVWTSPDISIAAFTDLKIYIETGAVLTEAGDYLRVYYQLDPVGGGVNFGAETLFHTATNGTATSTGISPTLNGEQVRIVIRVLNNGSGLGGDIFTFDNIAITRTLFSRADAAWNASGTWSGVALGGADCGCTPNQYNYVVIGNGNAVTVPAAAAAAGVLVNGTADAGGAGTLTFSGNFALDVGLGGPLTVNSGGVIDAAAFGDSRITFSDDRAHSLTNNGSISIGDISLAGPAFPALGTLTLNISGAGTKLEVLDDILTSTSLIAPNVNNNYTGLLFTVGGDIIMNASTVFANNQPLAVNGAVYFDTDNASFLNSSTFSGDITCNDNGDNNNSLTNAASGTANIGTINANDGDLIIQNSGTINQTGNFTNVDTGSNSDFNNLATGTWNWSYVPGGAFDANMSTILDCAAVGNTFNYNGAGDQTIIAVAYSNLSISTSGTKQPTAALDVNGNLTIQNSAVLNSNGQNMTLAGNWTVTGTASFTEGTQTVTFDGAGTQTLSNSSAPGGETFYNLTLGLGAAANTVQMNNTVTVSNTLTLTTGGLNLNGNQLNITRNATAAMAAGANGYLISATSASPYAPVVWNTRAVIGTFTFPFRTAAGGTAIPYVYNKTSAGTESGTGQISIATYATAASNTPFPSGVLHVKDASGVDQSANVADRYWIFNISGYSAAPGANVTFTIANAERPTGNPTLWAQRWDGTKWVTPPIAPSAANTTSVTITVPVAQMVNSPWTLLNNSVTLPIELIDFTALLKNGVVELEWSTASELNNDFFTIERATDPEQFEELLRIKGSGNTKKLTVYAAKDQDPLPGTSYYRLKQTDFDGNFSYSSVRSVFNPERFQLMIYPNPSNGGTVMLEISGGTSLESVPVRIINQTGQTFLKSVVSLDQKGYAKTSLETASLAPGLYIILLENTTGQRRKLVVK